MGGDLGMIQVMGGLPLCVPELNGGGGELTARGVLGGLSDGLKYS